jgi:hypothetical protein
VSGGYVSSGGDWSELATVAANIVADSGTPGKEEVQADQVRGIGDVVITVRDCAALASLSTRDRIVDARNASRIFDIRAIDRETGRRDVVIYADFGSTSGAASVTRGLVSITAEVSGRASVAGPSVEVSVDTPVSGVGVVSAPSVIEPEIVWSVEATAGGAFDWSAEDVQEGDVLIAMMAGNTNHNDPSGSGAANVLVTYDGFVYIHTPGSFSRVASLSARVVTAGNIADTESATLRTNDSGILFCVRGVDTNQFATTVGAGGWEWVTDTSIFAFAGGTNSNPPAITANAGDLVIAASAVWQTSPALTAMSGFTLAADAVSSGLTYDRHIAVASKVAEADGSVDPDQWGGFSTGSVHGGFTLALQAA